MTLQVENMEFSPLLPPQPSSLVQCTTCIIIHGSPDLQNGKLEAHGIPLQVFAYSLFSGPFIHSIFIYWALDTCHQGMHVPDREYFNETLLFTWLHLIFQQHGEVDGSIRTRECETCPESHTKSSPQREAEPSPSNPRTVLISKKKQWCPRPHHLSSLSPTFGPLKVIFFPLLTSLGFLSDLEYL